MKRTPLLHLLLVPLALLLVSAAPSPEVEDLVRKGNAAFERQEYDEALKLYEQAEERATDPGLVAFNKGAALFWLERYAEAERCFERCLEDGAAPPERQARAWYDLGNTRLQLGQDYNPKVLAEAIHCYRRCRNHPAADDELKAKAAHNLELARLLWLKARANPKSQDNQSRKEDQPTYPQKHKDERQVDPFDQTGDKGTPAGQGHTQEEHPADGKEKPIDKQDTAAGRGNLRTLPDDDKLVPLDAREAEEHLQRLVSQITREQRSPATAPRQVEGVKDW
jgi:tetratricopeptide (TPR) repeat protein